MEHLIFLYLNCTLTKIKMPMMYSDRSIINVYYPLENEDGSHTSISSSINTAARAAAIASMINKDVLISNHLNYVNVKETVLSNPARPACKWVSVTSHDLEGCAHQELKDNIRKR